MSQRSNCDDCPAVIGNPFDIKEDQYIDYFKVQSLVHVTECNNGEGNLNYVTANTVIKFAKSNLILAEWPY
jgi:hypothetical protein